MAAQDFLEQVVMITGAASGIGLATAIAFARHGALLSLADVNSDALEIASEACKLQSPNKYLPSCTVGDLTIPFIRETFKQNTLHAFGQIDVLVNCAGRLLSDSIANYDLDVFQTMMDTNVKLAYHLSALCAIPHLVRTKGCIVNVSSSASVQCRLDGILSYSMSKAALDHFTRHLAGELGPHGVRVNSINPGIVCTNIRGSIGSAQYETTYGNHSALKRCAEPEEIAETILFLASKKSSFTTGSCVLVDGGISVKRNDVSFYKAK